MKINIEYDELFDILLKSLETFTWGNPDSYRKSYPFFVKYFGELTEIQEEHFWIGVHFTYGWMPTVPRVGYYQMENTLQLLNDVKGHRFLTMYEFEYLMKKINNSVVGTSKLLHFINPNLYSIWDSHLAAFLYNVEKASFYSINKAENYFEYLDFCKKVIKDERFSNIHQRMLEIFGYPMSKLRTLEYLIYRGIPVLPQLKYFE